MSLCLKCNEQILGSPSVLNFLICSLTENVPLPTLIGPCRKAKITGIRSFHTSITAKSNSTILAHGTREINCKGQKTWNFQYFKHTWLSLQCLQWCVCFHYSRRIPHSLASMLEFRYVSQGEIYRNWAILA